MGVGLYLHGSYEPPAGSDDPVGEWLRSVSTWFDEEIAGDPFWGHFFTRCRHGKTYDGKPGLFVFIHPAGEEVEFIVPESGRATISAKTSTVGPGYHTALCQLLRRFGEEKKIRWNPPGEEEDSCHDETGYFFSGDRLAVEEEMLLHLQTIARISLETLETTGSNLEAWHMPIGHSYSEYPGGIRTPTGVRSEEWIRAVRDQPRNGINLYPWWEDGLTPKFFLGRALCELWCKIRWRPVLSDEEYDDWDWVHADLCRAYEADPTLDFPWREWAELIDILDEFEGATMRGRDFRVEVRERATQAPPDRPLIGYRRYPVTVDLLDGWSIRIPGEMAEAWDDLAWSAWDGKRTVWFNNWSVADRDGDPVPGQSILDAITLPEGELIPHHDGALAGKAILGETEEDGEVLLNLKAFSAVNGKYALCNVFYHDEDDYDWAVATWRSLTTGPSESDAER